MLSEVKHNRTTTNFNFVTVERPERLVRNQTKVGKPIFRL